MSAWMPFYWGDYFKKTLHLTLEEHGAYLLLLGAYWERGKALPDDNKFFQAVTKTTAKKWIILRPKVSEFFDISEGHWRHDRVEKELLRSSNRQESARANGMAGGLAKSKLTTTTITTTLKPKSQDTITLTTASRRSEIDKGFDGFWLLCPRKIGKGAAKKAYAKAVQTTSPDVLKEAMRRYAASRVGEPEQYTKHPATWLNAECWLDEAKGAPNGASGNKYAMSPEELAAERENLKRLGVI